MKKYPPTSKELREWMDEKGLSNKDVAKALRLSDGRVVRFWTAKKDPRPIPYPSWFTLRHKFRKRKAPAKVPAKPARAARAKKTKQATPEQDDVHSHG